MKKYSEELKSINLILDNSSIIERDNVKEFPNKLINLNDGILAFIGNHQLTIYAQETENLYYKLKEISDFFSRKYLKNIYLVKL